MAANNSELGDAFKSLAEASIDLPLLAIGRIFDRGFSDDLHRAGWKAYDAGIAVATQLTNRLYSNRRFGSISGRALDTTLKLQQLADAASGALFSALWPMLGLPTADELRRLSDQIQALNEHLRPTEVMVECANQLRVEQAPQHHSVSPMPHFQLSPFLDGDPAEVKRYASH